MPHFRKPETTRLILPTTKNLPEADQAWVEVRSKIYLGDMAAVTGIVDDIERGIATLARLIVNWNYTDEATGEPIKITPETINNLEKPDYEFLDKWINDAIVSQQEGLTVDEKKTSSATSTVASTGDSPTPPPQTAT